MSYAPIRNHYPAISGGLHIKPLIGNRVISQLKLADIERLQGDIAAGRTARPRTTSRGGQTAGGIGVAARAISTLRSLFNHARRLGLIEVSPATGVRVMVSQKLKRYLNAGEIRHLGKVMTQMEREGEHPTWLAAIRVMLLNGFRRMEVLAMRKEWVNLAPAHNRRWVDSAVNWLDGISRSAVRADRHRNEKLPSAQ